MREKQVEMKVNTALHWAGRQHQASNSELNSASLSVVMFQWQRQCWTGQLQTDQISVPPVRSHSLIYFLFSCTQAVFHSMNNSICFPYFPSLCVYVSLFYKHILLWRQDQASDKVILLWLCLRSSIHVNLSTYHSKMNFFKSFNI